MQSKAMTNGPHIQNFSIKGFRGINDLSIPHLGRVNLITGKNNTGKSSILEALRIFTQNASPSVIHSILQYREEVTQRRREEELTDDPEELFQISSLFHGFPRLSEKPGKIEFSAGGKNRSIFLNMFMDWAAVEGGSGGNRLTRFYNQQSSFIRFDDVAVLVAETEEGEKFYRLEDFLRYARPLSIRRTAQPNEARMPCVPVSSHGVGGTETLGRLWDEIVLTDIEQEVVKTLRIIDPQISAVSMIGDDGPGRDRRAIVRTDNIARPVPLKSFGDGMNRLFVIILSLANAGNGLLLVDEFESGLHHTVQLDAWRIIFRLAKELKVQVFATTHSNDAVNAFQQAAAETPEEGMLVRLTRREGKIIHTTFEESELSIATRDSIEVR